MGSTQAYTFKSIKRKELVYKVVQDEIKSFIVTNSLRPGDSLPPETELAHLLDVSRNSVREAVKSLEALGILESRAGSGLYVRDFSFDSILENLPYGMMFALKQLTDILEIRFYIENGMMARVSQQSTTEQLSRLENILVHMRTEAKRGKYWADDDRNFHQVLYENVNNQLLLKILDIFWMVFRRAQEQASIPDPRDPMDTYQRHEDIFNALKNHDLDAMCAGMKRHYEGIEARVKQLQLKHKAS